MKKIRDKATYYFLGAFLISSSLTKSNDIGFNGAVDASYGNSYDFYNFSIVVSILVSLHHTVLHKYTHRPFGIE